MIKLLILALFVLPIDVLLWSPSAALRSSLIASYEAQRLEAGYAQVRISRYCYAPYWDDGKGWPFPHRVCEIKSVKP